MVRPGNQSILGTAFYLLCGIAAFVVLEILTRLLMLWGLIPYVVFWQADFIAFLVWTTLVVLLPQLCQRQNRSCRAQYLIVIALLVGFGVPFVTGWMLEPTIRTHAALGEVVTFPGSMISEIRYFRRSEGFGHEGEVSIRFFLKGAKYQIGQIQEFYNKELQMADWRILDDFHGQMIGGPGRRIAPHNDCSVDSSFIKAVGQRITISCSEVSEDEFFVRRKF